MAYIHFKCSACGKHIEVDQRGAGRKVQCPDCSALIEVPYAREQQTCPHCRFSVLVSYTLSGTKINCSNCGKPYLVQGASKSIPIPDKKNGREWYKWQKRFERYSTKQSLEKYSCKRSLTGLQITRIILKILAWGMTALGIGIYLINIDSRIGVIGGTDTGGDDSWLGLPLLLFSSGILLILVSRAPWINGTVEDVREHWRSVPSILMETTRDWFRGSVSGIFWGILILVAILNFPTDGFKSWLSGHSSGEKSEWVSGSPKQSGSEWRKGNTFTALTDGRQLMDVEINNYKVIYDKSVTRDEASKLARHQSDGTQGHCMLMKYGGSYITAFLLSRDGGSDQEFKSTCQIVVISLSSVFNGTPVQVCFYDRSGNIMALESNQDSGSESSPDNVASSSGGGTETLVRETRPYVGRSVRGNSTAYERGYDYGRQMARLDRNYGDYEHASTDYSINDSFSMRASGAGYRIGTSEYGEFVTGYERGYGEER